MNKIENLKSARAFINSTGKWQLNVVFTDDLLGKLGSRYE